MISFSRTGVYLSTVREISEVRVTFAGNNIFWSVIQKTISVRVSQAAVQEQSCENTTLIELEYR